ncbi:MAG: hypothetical protein GC164_03470 [Phycisphaera sp.]|nr:hypothetical protein [Phycisphaera sp.]
MKRKQTLAALVLFNVVLLASLVVTVLSPQPAQAQFGAGKGNYTMVAGQMQGQPQSAIYILDLNRGMCYWIVYNSDNDKTTVIARADVGADLRAAIGGK